MVFYNKKFSPHVLGIKMGDFRRNHVELTFDGEVSVDPNELWESIFKNVFGNRRKLPIMFVIKEGDGDIIVDDVILESIEASIPTRKTDFTLV